MDVNAGAYLDGNFHGESWAGETLDLMIDVASGVNGLSGKRRATPKCRCGEIGSRPGPTDLDSVAAVSEVRDGMSHPRQNRCRSPEPHISRPPSKG